MFYEQLSNRSLYDLHKQIKIYNLVSAFQPILTIPNTTASVERSF